MYELRKYEDGKFDIYNTRRDKLVYQGMDGRTRPGTNINKEVLKFKNVTELMRHLVSCVSLATYKKVSKRLCAW